jgi:hypothetical protein
VSPPSLLAALVAPAVCRPRTIRGHPMLSPCVLRAYALVYSMTESARKVAVRMQALTAMDSFA